MFYVSTLINIDIFSILNQAKDGKAHRHSKAKQKKCNMRREHIQTNTEACNKSAKQSYSLSFSNSVSQLASQSITVRQVI